MTDSSANLDARELAALHVAGTLSDAEHTELTRRLDENDASLIAELVRLGAVAEQLMATVEPVPPPPALRDRIRAALTPREASPGFATLADGGSDPVSEDPLQMIILRRAELDWKDSGVPGVQTRNLFVDRASNRLTVLIRMAPGATYPDHEHPGVEECLVVEGDLSIAGTVLRSMDYLRTPAGGVHGEPRTEGGCLLLVTCPIETAA